MACWGEADPSAGPVRRAGRRAPERIGFSPMAACEAGGDRRAGALVPGSVSFGPAGGTTRLGRFLGYSRPLPPDPGAFLALSPSPRLRRRTVQPHAASCGLTRTTGPRFAPSPTRALCPWSLPVFTTSTPVITWLSVSVANGTLCAGRKPPSAIFITRAPGSVVDARALSFVAFHRSDRLIQATHVQAFDVLPDRTGRMIVREHGFRATTSLLSRLPPAPSSHSRSISRKS